MVLGVLPLVAEVVCGGTAETNWNLSASYWSVSGTGWSVVLALPVPPVETLVIRKPTASSRT